MIDLLTGAGAIVLLSAGSGYVGMRLLAKPNDRMFIIALAVVVAGVVLWANLLHGRLFWARLIPTSNVIVLSNGLPILLLGLAGAVAGRAGLPRWRRLLFAAAICCVAVYSFIEPFLGKLPSPATDIWQDGVLLQTNPISCSACAAGTLLREFDVATSEAEMSTLCLTRGRGTPTLGLYRGLKRKTQGTPLRVQVLSESVDELLADDAWPVLLLVRLERGRTADPRYEHEWGWTPGQGHAVVVFGKVGDDRLDVGDPSIGREQWTIDDLRVLWQGEGLRLVPHQR